MINNRHVLFIVIAVFTLGTISTAQAGMVNYERRKGVVTKPATKKKAPTAAPVQSQASSAYTNNAVAYGGSPKVTNNDERKFDANKDGMLQADEQKKFLKDVLAATQSKGGYTVNSDLLKKYDINGDGVITRYEIGGLQADTK